MNWFRFYHEALDDPKVQQLAPVMFKHWINLLCLASKSQPRGEIPPLKDVCFSLRMTNAKAIALLEEMVGYGLMDRVNGWYAPHNWQARQKPSDSSAARVQRYRERQNNNHESVTGNVTETFLKRSSNGGAKEEETETEKETEVNPPTPPAGECGGGEAPPKDPSPVERRFDRFWQAYPRKVGKQDALKAWKQRKPDDALTDQIILAIQAQEQGRAWVRNDGQYIPYPARWLREGRWEDEVVPATASDRSKITPFAPRAEVETFNGSPIYDYRGNPTPAYFLKQADEWEREDAAETADRSVV